MLRKVIPKMKINFDVIDRKSGSSLGKAFCTLSSVLLENDKQKVFLFSLMGAKHVRASLRVKVALHAVATDTEIGCNSPSAGHIRQP